MYNIFIIYFLIISFVRQTITSQNYSISAVDSDEARKYLNDKCHKYNKILINIGTSGVRAKTDIIIPNITYPLEIEEDYNKKNEFEMCTIKFYPSKIEHCIEWSNSLFHEIFFENIKLFNLFLQNKEKFINNMLKELLIYFMKNILKLKLFLIIIN